MVIVRQLVWLVRAYMSGVHSPLPLFGLSWASLPSLIACPFLSRSLSRPLLCCITLQPPLCCSLLARRLSSAVSFCRTTFECIFFSASLDPSPPCCNVSCLSCRVEPCLAFADSPAITIPLCTTPLPLLAFYLLSFWPQVLLPLPLQSSPSSSPTTTIITSCSFSLFFLSSQSPSSRVGQTLKKRSQSPNKRKLLLFE